MTKIAIISQAEQGVLIDISGCSSLSEAKQYLTSTLQVSSQFWEGLIVDLNLGPLVLTPEQVNEIQAIVSEVGVQPRQIFSLSPITRASLMQCRLPLGMLGQLQGYASMRPIEGGKDGGTPVQPVAQTSIPSVEAYYNKGSIPSTPSTNFSPESPFHADVHTAQALLTGEENSQLHNLEHMQASATIVEEPSTSAAEMLPDFLVARTAVLDQPVYNETQESQSSLSRLAMPNHHIPQTPPAVIPQSKVQTRSVANSAPQKPAAAVLLMKQTLRSGQSVSHKGHLVIIGDVNPGAELIADGDITVWGSLRGVAHAGASGNVNAEIRALKFEPIQLRIAHAIARSPDRNKAGNNAPSIPETARIIDGKIRLSVSDPE